MVGPLAPLRLLRVGIAGVLPQQFHDEHQDDDQHRQQCDVLVEGGEPQGLVEHGPQQQPVGGDGPAEDNPSHLRRNQPPWRREPSTALRESRAYPSTWVSASTSIPEASAAPVSTNP